MAAFHYQSKIYENIQPPSFGDHQENNDYVRERERVDDITPEEQIEYIKSIGEPSKIKSRWGNFLKGDNENKAKGKKKIITERTESMGSNSNACSIYALSGSPNKIPLPKTRALRTRPPSNLSQSEIAQRRSSSIISGEMKEIVPSLFLQEGAHLVSLLSAVALSTLRNDIEGVEAPLIEFIPGKPWPAYNSDSDPNIKHERSFFVGVLRFLFDISRTEKERAMYNVTRPFRVIGGISDGEAALLQSARGPTAKVALVNMWLNEFVIREHLHGAMGNVAAPIISRLQQYQSDGFFWYNSARKMAYIPFPFAHAQLTVMFLNICTVILPGEDAFILITFLLFVMSLLKIPLL